MTVRRPEGVAMKTQAYVLLPVILFLATGCQTYTKVTVERIDVDGGQHRIPGSSYADAVQSAAQGAARYMSTLIDLDRRDPPINVDMPSFVTSAGELVLRGRRLAVKEPLTEQEARTYTAEVEQYLIEQDRTWTEWADRSNLAIDVLSEIQRSIDGAQSAAFSYVVSAKGTITGGYGGYAATGVYTITPGDPQYENVLKAPVSGKPISYVHAGALGDASIMFVQESPTHIRVHHVNMDAERLAQMIARISDKALSAWIKYMNVP